MKKISENFLSVFIYLFCAIVLIELGVNFSAFYYLFPVKNGTSYGYVSKKTMKTVVPLNKYNSRLESQLVLPIELVYGVTFGNKELFRDYNPITKKYGYLGKKKEIEIDYKYVDANEFKNDFAIVAIEVDGKRKYGTIDKFGRWIVDPKYDSICPFLKYYTKACIDKKHCGVIDRFGNEITIMSYKVDKLQCDKNDCMVNFCKIGQNENDERCNYFL